LRIPIHKKLVELLQHFFVGEQGLYELFLISPRKFIELYLSELIERQIDGSLLIMGAIENLFLELFDALIDD
jgi:hypothetical protein